MGSRGLFSLVIVLSLCFVAGMSGQLAIESAGPADKWVTQGIQQALSALERGDNQSAQQIAASVIRSGGQGCWRAWLIVACAQRRSRRYKQACESYRQFLASCRNPSERNYVVGQIKKCTQAARKPDQAEVLPASKTISPARIKKLSLFSGRRSVESSEHFVVRAYNSDLAKLTAEHAESALERICRIILSGQDYPHSVDIYIWPTIADYRARVNRRLEFSHGSFSLARDESGRTVRRIDLVQLDGNGKFDVALLDRVLPHELCHLVFAEFLGDAPCPLALNEGLAMLAQASVDNSRLRLVGAAMTVGKAIPLEDLLMIQRGRPERMDLFYAESFSLVEYLYRNMSQQQFHEMLVNIKEGCCLSEALQRALCMPDDENFLKSLSLAWRNDAIKQWQFLKALDG